MPTTTRNTNLRFKGQLQTRSDVYALHNQALQHGPFMMDASSAHASNINTHTHTHRHTHQALPEELHSKPYVPPTAQPLSFLGDPMHLMEALKG